MRLLAIALAGIAAGCAPSLPNAAAGPDPADARSPVAPAPYVPVLQGATDYRPVAPKSWRDLNEGVAPRRPQ